MGKRELYSGPVRPNGDAYLCAKFRTHVSICLHTSLVLKIMERKSKTQIHDK
jgi:hypothetical protein